MTEEDTPASLVARVTAHLRKLKLTNRHIILLISIVALCLILATIVALFTRSNTSDFATYSTSATIPVHFPLPNPAGHHFAPVLKNRDLSVGFGVEHPWDQAKVYGFTVLPLNPPVFMALPYEPPGHHSTWIYANADGEEPLRHAFLFEMSELSRSNPWARCQVLDLGANYGIWALMAGSLGCSVVAVEPADNIAATLFLSVRMNDLGRNIKVVRKAVLTQTELVKGGTEGNDYLDGGMSNVQRNRPSSLPKPTPVHGTLFPNDDLWSSPVTDLAKMAPLTETDPILLLKIDVEGCDLEALRSALPLLKAKKVINIFSEMGPPAWWKRCSGSAHIDPIPLYTEAINAGVEMGVELDVEIGVGIGYEMRLISPIQIAVRPIANPGGGKPPGRGAGMHKELMEEEIYGRSGSLPDPYKQGDIPEYSVVEVNDLPMFMEKYYGNPIPYKDAGGAQGELWFRLK